MSDRLEDLLPPMVRSHFIGKAIGKAIEKLKEKYEDELNADSQVAVKAHSAYWTHTSKLVLRIEIVFPYGFDSERPIFSKAIEAEGLDVKSTTFVSVPLGSASICHSLAFTDFEWVDVDIKALADGVTSVSTNVVVHPFKK